MEYGKPVPDFLEKMMALGYEIYDMSAQRDKRPMVKGDASWGAVVNGRPLSDLVMFHRPSMDKLGLNFNK